MNWPYSQNLVPPVHSVSAKGSKSKSRWDSSSASRKELVKAELLVDHEKTKAERKLEKLKLQEKQFTTRTWKSWNIRKFRGSRKQIKISQNC